MICERLGAIEGVRSVTRGWPRQFDRLPCVAVSKASDTTVDVRDDREYAAELEYYIRVFARRTKEADTLAEAVDAQMEALGYTRTFSYDGDEPDVRVAALRYRKTI